MKVALKVVICLFLPLLYFWLIGSFTASSLDINTWDVNARALIAIISAITSLFSFIFWI